MAKSPAFQLYVQDFLNGTSEMTAEEVGGYIRLLCRQWDKGGLPDDDVKLRKISGVKLKSLKAIREKFLKKSDGLLYNTRLEKVLKDQHEYKLTQSLSGKEGAKARWGRHEVAIGSPMAKNGSSSSSSSSPSIVVDDDERKFLILKEKILLDKSFVSTATHRYMVDEKLCIEAIEDFFSYKIATTEFKKILNEEDCRRNLLHSIPIFKSRKANPHSNGNNFKANGINKKHIGSSESPEHATNPDQFKISRTT